MPLPIGTRIGPYEITGILGAGGMGEVYRARDARLARDVALKVLPEIFASDRDRLARFEREAQVLAALKHQNIAAIYGLEESDDGVGSHIRALVLELVEGETLADRIARGPIPLDDALPIAKEIAEALQAAHEQGIVHRDLKPSNIKVQPDGLVKVLDFGLAKLTDASAVRDASRTGEAPLAHLSMTPTLTSPVATGVGVMLGTAAYMAPEQAKGRPADKRSDVWAFGCVLFEMLSGKRAFDAEDVSDTLALVLKGEPDWQVLPADVPRSLETLIRSCLTKTPGNRLADISGAHFVLTHLADLTAAVSAPVPTLERRPWRARISVAAIVVSAAAITAAGMWLATRTVPPVARFFVTLPDGTAFITGLRPGTSAAISPDGRTLAFTARDSSGNVLLWLRPLGALTAQALDGTDGAQFPFWSPDSRFIGYFTQDRLMKVAAIGGPPQTISAVTAGRGGAWSEDGQIVYGVNTGPLYRVSSVGGAPSMVTRLAKGVQDHRFPSWLPDGQHVLFYSTAVTGSDGVFAASLETGETKRVIESDTGAVYDATHGYLLFGRQGALMAQSFDPETLSVEGDPFPIAEQLESGVYAGVVTFSVTNGGALAYGVGAPPDAGLRLVWVDRRGNAVGTVGPVANYRQPELAPDGKRVAVKRREARLERGDIWVTDVTRDATSRFTFDASQANTAPIWSRDGSRIVFASLRGGKWGLYTKPANGAGSEEQLLESQAPVTATSWSSDGRSVVYVTVGEKTATDVWLLPLLGERKPIPLVMTPFNDNRGQVSPDGKWLAYDSNESGQSQVYVKPFPAGESKWQVSSGSGLTGFYPRWRGDGRELFYMDLAGGGKLMAVEIAANGAALEFGTPTPLFDSGFSNLGGERIPGEAYAVSSDGQRFLIPRPAANVASISPIAVVLNWVESIQH
jgi:Tol biopolymer transport system component